MDRLAANEGDRGRLWTWKSNRNHPTRTTEKMSRTGKRTQLRDARDTKSLSIPVPAVPCMAEMALKSNGWKCPKDVKRHKPSNTKSRVKPKQGKPSKSTSRHLIIKPQLKMEKNLEGNEEKTQLTYRKNGQRQKITHLNHGAQKEARCFSGPEKKEDQPRVLSRENVPQQGRDCRGPRPAPRARWTPQGRLGGKGPPQGTPTRTEAGIQASTVDSTLVL